MTEGNAQATSKNAERGDFIRRQIEEDLSDGRCVKLVTRFPPEPSGYLHIGHAKALLLNWSLARRYDGDFHLRLDDTNPLSATLEFAEAIEEDARWLGCDWQGRLRRTSDCFEMLYEQACELVRRELAYVCDLDGEAIRQRRGTLSEPGVDSPDRGRSVAENLRLLEGMRAGQFDAGRRVLRARIDMAAPNINMRDPVLYRIIDAQHYRTGREWPIYPSYDFSHCLVDAAEGVTHSLCTLEFADHRPLYDWFLQALEIDERPRQIEFARLNIAGALTSKRALRRLDERGLVRGWDDPRLMTLRGLRRRGYPPEAIAEFCAETGVNRSPNMVAVAQLESFARARLDDEAPRAMCVLRPLRVRLSNWHESEAVELSLPSHPNRPQMGERKRRLGRELFIERDDYSADPPKGYKRLAPGRAVRLRGAWVIHFEEAECDADGLPTLLHCRVDWRTLGSKPDYPVAGVIHWVADEEALTAQVRLLEPLLAVDFDLEEPEAALNPDSMQILEDCKAEASLADMEIGARRQFERLGYFCLDADSSSERLVFNRIVSLRESWTPKAV